MFENPFFNNRDEDSTLESIIPIALATLPLDEKSIELHKSFIELVEGLNTVRFESFLNEIYNIRKRDIDYTKSMIETIKDAAEAFMEGNFDECREIQKNALKKDKEIERFYEREDYDMLLETVDGGYTVINIKKPHLNHIHQMIEKYHDAEDALGEVEVNRLIGSEEQAIMGILNQVSSILKIVISMYEK